MSQEFGAVVVTGLAIFGLAFVASQADLDFSGGGQADSMQLYERNFGSMGSAEEDSRTVDLGSFTVGEGRGEVLADRRETASVSRQLLSGETLEMTYTATQPRDGKLEFEVLGRTGKGQLYVEVNGERVFQNHLVTEAEPTVEIPSSALSSGQNTVTVGTTKGGFFSSASYSLEDVKLYVNDRKFHDRVDTFRMFRYELADFIEGELSFNVAEAVKPEPMEIMINGRQVYSLDRVRGRESVDINPVNSDLAVGLNTIRFQTDGEAKYSLENTDLTFRYVGRTSRAEAVDSFTLNQEQLDYARGNDTRETVSFRYRTLVGSPGDLNLTINGDSRLLRPSNGRNTYSIDADTLQQSNTLAIEGDGSFQLNSFRIISETVEG